MDWFVGVQLPQRYSSNIWSNFKINLFLFFGSHDQKTHAMNVQQPPQNESNQPCGAICHQILWHCCLSCWPDKRSAHYAVPQKTCFVHQRQPLPVPQGCLNPWTSDCVGPFYWSSLPHKGGQLLLEIPVLPFLTPHPLTKEIKTINCLYHQNFEISCQQLVINNKEG